MVYITVQVGEHFDPCVFIRIITSLSCYGSFGATKVVYGYSLTIIDLRH